MASLNKVMLIGNLGKDPELRRLENGTPVTTFSIATSEFYKDKSGDKVSKTEWHNIVLWRGLAEISEKYLKKGNKVYIEGKIQNRSWEDQDKNTRYITEVVADQMIMLGSANKENSESKSFSNQYENDTTKSSDNSQQNQQKVEEDDELPF